MCSCCKIPDSTENVFLEAVGLNQVCSSNGWWINSYQIKWFAYYWFVQCMIIQALLMICLNLFPLNRSPSSRRWQILSMVPIHLLANHMELLLLTRPALPPVCVSSVVLHVWTGLPACFQRFDVLEKHFPCFLTNKRRHFTTVYVSDFCTWNTRPFEFHDVKRTAPAGRVLTVFFTLIHVP